VLRRLPDRLDLEREMAGDLKGDLTVDGKIRAQEARAVCPRDVLGPGLWRRDPPARPVVRLARFFSRNLRALLACLGKTNRDRLLPACHFPALSSSARSQSATLPATHRTLHRLTCRLTIPRHVSSYRSELGEL